MISLMKPMADIVILKRGVYCKYPFVAIVSLIHRLVPFFNEWLYGRNPRLFIISIFIRFIQEIGLYSELKRWAFSDPQDIINISSENYQTVWSWQIIFAIISFANAAIVRNASTFRKANFNLLRFCKGKWNEINLIKCATLVLSKVCCYWWWEVKCFSSLYLQTTFPQQSLWKIHDYLVDNHSLATRPLKTGFRLFERAEEIICRKEGIFAVSSIIYYSIVILYTFCYNICWDR